MANAGTNHLLYQQGFQATDNLYFRLQEGLQRARYGDFMASLVLHTTVILEQANLLRELLQDSRTMFTKVMENTQAIKSLENKTTALERQFLEQNLLPPSQHSQPATCTVFPQVGEPSVHIMCGPARNDQAPLLSLARMAQTQHVDAMYPYQRPAICQPPPPPPPPDYPNVRHPILPHQQYAFSGNPVFPVQRSYGIVQHPPRMYPPQQIAVPHHRLSIVDSSAIAVEISPPAVSQSTTTITTTTATTVANSTAVLSSNRTSVFPHLILPEGISIIPLSPSKSKKTAKEASKNDQPSVVIQPVSNNGVRNGKACPQKRIASPVVVNRPPVLPSISINELQVDAVDERNPANKRSAEKGMNLDRLLQKITVLSQNRPVADPVLPVNEKINTGLPVGSRRRKSYSKQRPQYVSPVYEDEEEEEIDEYPEIAELGYLNESLQSHSDKEEPVLPIIIAVEGSVDLSESFPEEAKECDEIEQLDTGGISMQEMCNEGLPDIENELFLMQEYDENALCNENDIATLNTNLDSEEVECVVNGLISNVEILSVENEDDESNKHNELQETDAQDQLHNNTLSEICDEAIDDEMIGNDYTLQLLSGENSSCCDGPEMDERLADDYEKPDDEVTLSIDSPVEEKDNSNEGNEEISCTNANKVPSAEKDNLNERRPAKKSKFSIWSAMAYRSRKKKRKPKIKLENTTATETIRRSKKTKVTPVWPSQDIVVRRSKRKALSHDFFCTEKPQKIVSPVIIVGKLNKTQKRHNQGMPTLAAMQSRLDTLQMTQPDASDEVKSGEKGAQEKKKRVLQKRKKSKKSNEKRLVDNEISFTQTILSRSDALTAVSALEEIDCPVAVRDVVVDLVEITHLREQAETEGCDDVSTNGGSFEMATLTKAIRIWQEHDYSRFPIELLKSADVPELQNAESSSVDPELPVDQSCAPQLVRSDVETESGTKVSLEIASDNPDNGDTVKTKEKVNKGKYKSCRRSIKTKCSTCSDCQDTDNQTAVAATTGSQTTVESSEEQLANAVNASSASHVDEENVDNIDDLKDAIRTKLQRLRADSSSPSVDREDDYSCLLKTFVQKRSVFNENNSLVPSIEQNVNIKSLKHRLSFAIAGGLLGFSEDDESSSLQPQVQCVNIFSIHEIWKYLKCFINDTSRTVLALHQLGNKEIQQFLVLARLCLLDAHKDESDLYFKKTDQTQDLSVVMLEKAIKVLESNNALID